MKIRVLQNPLQGSLQNKQKSDLPSIPSDESNSIHSSGSESNYYSAAEERGAKDRIFSESEFCILLTLKVGTIYNRWMGTIRMSSDVNKCAVLTTIAEGVMKKNTINWNAFVKRTLDLPTTDRLTRIEGIAVDKNASKIVALKKTQMDTVSFNQFPPESFFRNEYTAESDVWSTAVVIWEILSR
ncbi:hypothetical protein BSL78_30039, partial [Apostichopus japonicus]